MNCKQGDLAVIVRSTNGNEGKIVRCLRLDRPHWYDSRFQGGVWEVDRVLIGYSGPLKHVADSQLRPLRDNNGEDEVLRTVPERDEAAEHALLERAAFAAGLVVKNWIAWGGAWVYHSDAPANADGEFPIFKWAPLEDDADAFRLSLLLRISVWRDDDLMRVGTLWQAFTLGADVAAIARRLIVRAAAMCVKPPNGKLTGHQ